RGACVRGDRGSREHLDELLGHLGAGDTRARDAEDDQDGLGGLEASLEEKLPHPSFPHRLPLPALVMLVPGHGNPFLSGCRPAPPPPGKEKETAACTTGDR